MISLEVLFLQCKQAGATKLTNVKILLGSIFSFTQPSSTEVEILAKPWKRFLFKSLDAKATKEVYSALKAYVPPDLSLKKALCSSYRPDVSPSLQSADLAKYEPSGIRFGKYFPPRDFERMGVENKYKLGSFCMETVEVHSLFQAQKHILPFIISQDQLRTIL